MNKVIANAAPDDPDSKPLESKQLLWSRISANLSLTT